MEHFEDRARARLDAAVRKTLQEGQLGADAAPAVSLPPLQRREGRDAHAIAVHGNGNVIYVGGHAPPVPGLDARAGGRRVPRRALAIVAALLLGAVTVAAFASSGARFFADHVSRAIAAP